MAIIKSFLCLNLFEDDEGEKEPKYHKFSITRKHSLQPYREKTNSTTCNE